MRVGVVPYLNPESGGMHQYSLSVLDALAQLGELGDAPSIVLLVRAEDAGRERSLAPYPWPVMRLPGNGVYAARAAAERLLGGGAALDALAKAFVRGRGRRYRDPEALRRDPELARVLRDARLDWLFLTFPSVLGFEAGVPYVMPIHDLQHRLQPEFPEVSENGEANSPPRAGSSCR